MPDPTKVINITLSKYEAMALVSFIQLGAAAYNIAVNMEYDTLSPQQIRTILATSTRSVDSAAEALNEIGADGYRQMMQRFVKLVNTAWPEHGLHVVYDPKEKYD